MAARVDGDPRLHWSLGRGWKHLTLCGAKLSAYVASVVPGPMIIDCRICWQRWLDLFGDDDSYVRPPYCSLEFIIRSSWDSARSGWTNPRWAS
jgi:hypothetical protein